MTINKATSLFFDATCLFAAAHSSTGGSAYLVLVCAHGYLKAIASPDVLIEAERNLLEKSTNEAFHRYRNLIGSTPLQLTSAPSESAVADHAAAFFEDAHVVAAALEARAEYLITLDRGLERRIGETQLPIVGISPGAFIQTVLSQHPDYERIRRSVT